MKNTETPFLPQGLFTSCPNCMQQFHIQAAQLSMAYGRVECGTCGHQFSVLSRLSDIPLVLDESNYEFNYEPAHGSDPIREPDQEPEFEIPISSNVEEFNPEVDQQEIDATPSVKEVEADEEGLPSKFPEHFPKSFPDDFPDELRETLPAKRSLFATICWGFGAFLLLLIIVAQLAWFNRDQLLMHYPQLDPIAREICERLHCE
ncbi:MAG: DUF3426 domain-containing protein, partial [Gammaproteobacteria bacterium]